MLASRHYMLDAYGCILDQANSIMSVNDLLVFLSNELEMKPIMPPFIVPYYYCDDADDVGISAFCFCANGSHITIHTFPYRSCYFVDILSDCFFSENDVTNMIKNQIFATTLNSRVVDRRIDEADSNIDENQDFGPHYTITVQDVEVTFEEIYKWLDTIAPQINMQPIARPYVVYDKTEDPQYISGALIVAQSHVAFHYSIAERVANIDIFSCSFLENSLVENLIKSTFGKDVKVELFARGSKYHHEIQHYSRENRNAKSNSWRENI